ncbi:MAG TPA: hypothetical protein VNI20_11560 [Fimbriimonadaceae bacterium]|nr:hypothetical protein [Fimbriimonadaceae bacterium]
MLVDVVFEYVIAYHLEQDDFENIIGEVREDDLANFVEREAARFAGAQKRGWPGDWSQGPESVLQFLRESQARAYGLESPFGLQGWVLARSVEFVRVKK